MEYKVLILDDSLVSLTVLSGLLKSTAFSTVTFSDPRKALNDARDNCYDFFITDYLMPEMDGVSFTKEIRKIEKYINTPVFILTSEYTEEEANQFFNAGINVVLNKPVTREELLSELEAHRVYVDAFKEMKTDTLTEEQDTSKADEALKCLYELFCSEGKCRIKAIKELLQTGSFDEYTALVHGVKGESRLIDQHDLAEAFLSLEIAGKKLLGIVPTKKNKAEIESYLISQTPICLELYENKIAELEQLI